MYRTALHQSSVISHQFSVYLADDSRLATRDCHMTKGSMA
jgi:hypothetical protein